jgi:hypothetical protein
VFLTISGEFPLALSPNAGYDEENRFFQEDFEELRDAGYLRMNVPKEFGGRGLSLAEVCQEQRRLAYYAHATALAVNMHLYWVGVVADLWRAGDTSCEWLLQEAAAGEILAAGHAESGNDLPLPCPPPKQNACMGFTALLVVKPLAVSHPCGPGWASMAWTPAIPLRPRLCMPL